MKKWNNPEIWSLSAGETKAGTNGHGSDNVTYDVSALFGHDKGTDFMIGTSGTMSDTSVNPVN